MPDPSRLLPTCPRCAYDLSGASEVRGGNDQGVCSECGLEFKWRDVLDPERAVPRWFVEKAHARIYRTLPGTTLRACLTPWRFWRSVKMHFPMRPVRMIAFLIFMVLGFHLAAGVVPLLTAVNNVISGMSASRVSGEFAGLLLNPYTTSYDAPTIWVGSFPITFEVWRTINAGPIMGIALICLMPLVPLLLRQTRRHFKVRAAHVWRITAYTFACVPCMVVLHGFVTVLVVNMEWGYGPGPIGNFFEALAAVLRPVHRLFPLPLASLILDVAWIGLIW